LAALGFVGAGQGSASDTIAAARGHGLGITRVRTHGNLEVHGPVFFAGQVGAPWRFAVTAIVERAAAGSAAGVKAGAHHGANISHLGSRTCDARWCLGGNTAVQRRVELVAPAGCGLAEFNHRDAMQIDFFEHFQLRTVA
jgi:hypothetical protein